MVRETFDMAEYERDLDEGMKRVMPEHWPGHIRLMSGKKREFAEKLTERLIEKGHSEKKSRAAAIRKANENFD